MAQLSQIKNRISAVQKTQKITRAMRLIAMSLYSKLERQRASLSAYEQAVSGIAALLKDPSVPVPKMFVPDDLQNHRPLIILCSSTKGLCGGMNSSILRYFEKTFLLEKHQRAHFIAIGGKACAFMRDRQPGVTVYENAECTIPAIGTIAASITQLICDATEAPYTSVVAYHTHLKNFFLQTPMKLSLIPFDVTSNGLSHTEALIPASEYLWEQDMESIGTYIARHYLYTRISHLLFDNLISENAARFIAMDQSTNNAEKYLESLGLAYNKSRQSLITREIAELSSGIDE